MENHNGLIIDGETILSEIRALRVEVGSRLDKCASTSEVRALWLIVLAMLGVMIAAR